MSIVSIKNAIKNKLDDISSLRNVYTFETGSPDGFPYATVTNDSFDGDFADFSATSKRNKRTFNFNVNVYVEKNEASFGSSKSESVMDSVADEILTAFDMDTTLSGTCLYVKVVSGDLSYLDAGNIMRFAQFKISCENLVNSL